MQLERELEIARKVREIHGPRSLGYGDCYVVPPFNKKLIATNEYDLDMVADGDVCIWLPTDSDYMKMLWEIDNDRFILADDGVYIGKVDYHEKEWTFDYDTRCDSPSEAWMKVVEDAT